MSPLAPQSYRKTALIHRVGTTASKPAATDVLAGTLYFSTDAGTLERSNGTTWETYASSGGGAATLPTDTIGKVLISQGTGVQPIYSPFPIVTAVLFGTNPALGGAIRLPNNEYIAGRSSDNTSDRQVLKVNNDNAIIFGGLTNPETTYIDAGAAIRFRVAGAAAQYTLDDSTGFWPTGTNTRDLGASTQKWRTGRFGTSVEVGDNPAQSGAIRLANDQQIRWRNTANTADGAYIRVSTANDWFEINNPLNSIYIRGNQSVYLDAATLAGPILVAYNSFYPGGDGSLNLGYNAADGRWAAAYLRDLVSIGTNPAQSGAIRLANNGALYGRNVGNTADEHLIRVNTDDTIIIGHTSNALILQGSANILANDSYSGGNFMPNQTNVRSLGRSDLVWKDAYIGTVNATDLGSTPLNASNLTSGTIPDARLSTNVALKNTSNTFTQNQSISKALPILNFVDTAQPADQRIFRYYADNQQFIIDSVNDAQTAQSGFAAFNRQGDIKAYRNITEKNRTMPMGHWADIPFNAANFSGSGGMTWTVGSPSVFRNRYCLIGNTMFWSMYISWFSGSNVTGGTASNIVGINHGLSVSGVGAQSVLIDYQQNISGVPILSGVKADVVTAGIQINKADATNFPVGVALGFIFTIAFEVS